MQLDHDDCELFYGLHKALMSYVDRRLKGVEPPAGSAGVITAFPPSERLELRDALVGHLEWIDAFADENPFGLPEQELGIVRSWKDLVAGEFYVFRYLKKHTVFLSTAGPPVAYGVLALRDPFEELIGQRLPYFCKTVLLPFQGRIVYDGVLAGYNLQIGGGIKRSLDKRYREAKEWSGVVTSLPAPAGKPRPTGTRSAQRRPPTQPRRAGGGSSIPAAVRPAHDRIVALTDSFCRDHLDDEYLALCRQMAATLARKRPSPLVRGKPGSWASGIVRAVGWVNFLGDPSQPHSMRMADIDEEFGVSEATGSAKLKAIRNMLGIRRFEPEWTLPAMMDNNPLIWMLEVNGLIVDIRVCPREVQVIAFENGLIPYIPADRAGESVEG